MINTEGGADQLNFGLNSERNYFIYDNCNENNSNPIEAYTDEEDDKNANDQIENDNDKAILTNQPQLVLPEQLEYKMPNPNTNVFPTEQANALYYKKPSTQAKAAPSIKKKNTRKRKKPIKKASTYHKKPPKANIKEAQAQGKSSFTFNAISNPKGLFDPHMKVHELDLPSRTQKQRSDRMEKIKNYEVRFGKKVKKLDMYSNNFDAYEDLENRKNEIDFKRHNYSRDSIAAKDDLRKIIESIPKEKLLYTKSNLEFNFSKYEKQIELLEQQIKDERRLRKQTNQKYKQMLNEAENEKGIERISNNRRNSSTKKRSKTPRTTFHRRQGHLLQRAKLRKRLNKSSGNTNRGGDNDKSSLKRETEKRIKEQARVIASSQCAMIDRDIDALAKELLLKQNEIMNLKQNSLPAQNKSKQAQTGRVNKNQQIRTKGLYEASKSSGVPQVPYQSNSGNNMIPPNSNRWISFPNNALIESSIANEVFRNNSIENSNGSINPTDKFNLLSKVNHTLDNYSKGLPQLMNKVTKTLKQLNQGPNDIFSEKASSLIKAASKSKGQTVQLHIDELIAQLIDDLTLELVIDLQHIEDKNLHKSHTDNFALSVSSYYSHFKQLCSIEDDVKHKLSSKVHPLTPYIPIEKVRKELSSNIIIEPPIDHPNDFFIKERMTEPTEPQKLFVINKQEKRAYSAMIHDGLNKDCNRYLNEYAKFQESNRNFFIPNEYALYDEIVNEEVKRILDDEVNRCVYQIDDCVNDLFHKELVKEQ